MNTPTPFVNTVLKKLGIKSNLKELLLALLEISKGEIYFVASYSDLANLLYESDERKHYEKIRYALNTLQKWQEQNGLELIEIVEKGGRRKTKDGQFKYEKTKFRFVLLERLALFVSDGKELNLEEFLKDLGLSGSSIRHKTKYHPRHQMKKDKSTIFTKFRRLFHQAVELGENPVKYCKHILDESQLLINDLRDDYIEQQEDYIEQQEKEKFIAEFEQLVDDSNKLEECNPVLHRAENYHLITREII